ncbi:hypothetical protein JMY81_01130 [Brenneria goodwinii]|uniref:Cyanophage baseplate Pam3 plug gp18 domain-containing protein n=1 Tax=Brenneria goodwinii TaxID=1109412 RepID=A0A0G4K148_9GAMM|nr:hypothetical protein [Brenneria goodwinii]MCG8155198.1 hypothetical protein [Brenneria goodwinii]MCG8159442.1 hypothetical protein [Brenneria goodwinii]MCG8164389.1 hypothetical protein [Brenneria goodwinii]MCG8169045.1 hypothetical protein [Brenneria goodwinii]MCG8173301.1 hypothetical protein [Brenneria goodwinii]
MKTIPLARGLADFSFTSNLNDTLLRFNVRWLTRYGYFVVDIRDTDNAPIALGRALHVGINLLAGLNTDIGKIVLEGETPTLANLGVTNNLNWYPDD